MNKTTKLPNTDTSFDAIVLRTSRDPQRFDELLIACETQARRLSARRRTFNDTSLQSFDEALATLAADYSGTDKAGHLVQSIERLEYPAYLVRNDGRLLVANVAAEVSEEAGYSGDDWLAFDLEGDERIADVVAEILRPGANAPGELTFRKAYSRLDNSSALLVFSPAVLDSDRSPVSMVFVVEPKWREEVVGMLARTYELSGSEAEILKAFLNGQDLATIAERRGRSLATVRTQFQSVLTKSGASGQADILRLAMSLAQFVEAVEPIGKVAGHPLRKSFDLMRPGQRRLEIVLSGALDGNPVLFLPDVTQFTFQADLEAAFEAVGICMVSIARPGHGRSDPQPEGVAYDACLAEDLKAVQDQLGVAKTPILAKNMSSPIAFRLAGLMPERITNVVIASPVLPPSYLVEGTRGGKWTSALSRALTVSPKLFLVLARAGLRTWRSLGARRMNNLQFRKYPPDLVLANRPDTLEEIETAREAYVAQSMERSEVDLQHFLWDWSVWVEEVRAPVTLFAGQQDQINRIEACRAFAKEYSHNVRLVEVKDGGFLAMLSHPDQWLELLELGERYSTCSM